MGVDGVEADYGLSVVISHCVDADVVGLRQLVGRPFKEIVDLGDAAGKSRPIVLCRIERLELRCLSLLGNDRLCMTFEGIPQFVCRGRRIIERVEERPVVCRRQ